MKKLYSTARLVILFVIIAMILTVYVSALYNVQVYQQRFNTDTESQGRIIRRTSTIAAARGNIYDRNGALLASGRPSHNVRLDWSALRGKAEANDVVLELIYAATDAGHTYVDTFPVTRGAPFEFLSGMSETQRNRLNRYYEYFNLKDDITVSDLIAWFYDHYKIDMTVNILDARLIIGVRYELEIRAIIGSITPYIFASDVSTEFVSYIAERNLTGVYTETAYIREYHTNHAPHLLGYIGLMTAEEYERYKELGYPMTAMVGKTGVEFAFEDYLHGSEGERTMLLNEEGTILSDIVTTVPKPGEHIYLTIDLNLQIAAENALRTTIEERNQYRRDHFDPESDDELELITAGAVVVTNVNTGEVLASVSYPTFNLSTLSRDWAYLENDPAQPMLNRATNGRYSPGSTFKMVTLLAVLRNVENISKYYPVEDKGRYTAWEHADFTAQCWLFGPPTYSTHGTIDMISALACSCNYYFLEITDMLAGRHAENAAAMFDEASMAFGLGLPTGIELPENIGLLANPEVKRYINRNRPQSDGLWYNADVLLTGFGQSIHRFSPLQLANYVATIGNGGTVYKLSLLRRVVTSDFSETIFEHSTEILNQIEDTDNIAIIQEGMRAVVTGTYAVSGTARDEFVNYRIPVAAKTGTVQSETQRMNDGLFVCYAPADEPEIAISVVVEKGGSGAEINRIARMIMDHYFVSESSYLAVPYGQLIP